MIDEASSVALPVCVYQEMLSSSSSSSSSSCVLVPLAPVATAVICCIANRGEFLQVRDGVEAMDVVRSGSKGYDGRIEQIFVVLQLLRLRRGEYLACRNETRLFWSFPYVCPEPVLVK